MVQQDAFLEWADVFGNLYGTGRQDTEQLLATGLDLVLVIDVQGARQVRQRMTDAVERLRPAAVVRGARAAAARPEPGFGAGHRPAAGDGPVGSVGRRRIRLRGGQRRSPPLRGRDVRDRHGRAHAPGPARRPRSSRSCERSRPRNRSATHVTEKSTTTPAEELVRVRDGRSRARAPAARGLRPQGRRIAEAGAARAAGSGRRRGRRGTTGEPASSADGASSALGVTGGIGAYKAVEVARLLQKRGHASRP